MSREKQNFVIQSNCEWIVIVMSKQKRKKKWKRILLLFFFFVYNKIIHQYTKRVKKNEEEKNRFVQSLIMTNKQCDDLLVNKNDKPIQFNVSQIDIFDYK